MILKQTDLSGYISINIISDSTNQQRSHTHGIRTNLGRRTLDASLENDTMASDLQYESKSRNLEINVNSNKTKITKLYASIRKGMGKEYVLSRPMYTSEEKTQINNENDLSFEYLKNSPYICSDPEESDVYLLVLILSHPENKMARNAIRDTWGSISRHQSGDTVVRIVFLLGTSDQEATTNAAIKKESSLYRDVVQADFMDTYQNLTIKTLMGLQWAREFCTNVQFILKTDDDTLVHVPSLLGVLKSQRQTLLILGAVNTNSLVMRNGRWKVSREKYPAPTYPPYCNGAAYVLSADVAWMISGAAKRAPIVPLEDVYITGIIPRLLGLRPVSHPGFGFWTTKLNHPCDMIKKHMVSAHALPPETLYIMWDAISRKNLC